VRRTLFLQARWCGIFGGISVSLVFMWHAQRRQACGCVERKLTRGGALSQTTCCVWLGNQLQAAAANSRLFEQQHAHLTAMALGCWQWPVIAALQCKWLKLVSRSSACITSFAAGSTQGLLHMHSAWWWLDRVRAIESRVSTHISVAAAY
jgi:hypothetical protein